MVREYFVQCKGVYNLSSQLSSLAVPIALLGNARWQNGISRVSRPQFKLPQLCYSSPKTAIIPTTLSGNHVKYLETMILGNLHPELVMPKE